MFRQGSFGRVAAAFIIGAAVATAPWAWRSLNEGEARDLFGGEASAAQAANRNGNPWSAAPAAFQATMLALDSAYGAAAAQSPAQLRRLLASQLARGTDGVRSLVVEWIAKRGLNTYGDLLVDAVAVGGTEVRRKAAGTLVATPSALVTAAAHGATLIRLHGAETDPDVKQDLGALRQMLGV